MEDRQDVIRRLDHPGYASTFLSTFDIKIRLLHCTCWILRSNDTSGQLHANVYIQGFVDVLV